MPIHDISGTLNDPPLGCGSRDDKMLYKCQLKAFVIYDSIWVDANHFENCLFGVITAKE
jgi:hypothetical protein